MIHWQCNVLFLQSRKEQLVYINKLQVEPRPLTPSPPVLPYTVHLSSTIQ